MLTNKSFDHVFSFLRHDQTVYSGCLRDHFTEISYVKSYCKRVSSDCHKLVEEWPMYPIFLSSKQDPTQIPHKANIYALSSLDYLRPRD